MSSAEIKAEEEEETVKGGELLFCGTTCWGTISKKYVSSDGKLVSPTRLRPLVGIDIRFVAAGSTSCHCVALDVEGRCYTWGRNDKGQLGHGDKIQRDRPTVVSEMSSFKLVKAASGKSHTVVVTEDGLSLGFGWNKHGQLGSGSVKNEFELSPVRCQVTEVKTVACGADFTVWLTSVEGSTLVTAGHPQYGQLGHGTDNEYNTKDSSVRLAYEAQPHPTPISAFSGETIVNIACGANHTVALDSKGYVYTWGYGGYGRLGHKVQKDEWSPRRIEIFTKHNVVPFGAVLSAGSLYSSITAGGGLLYMWGKIKNTGNDWMYPKPLMDLSGWNLRCMASGSFHHFVGADNSCISWGNGQSGELGYGPLGQKSSAVPKKVNILDGMHVISVACGYAHSLVVVDRANVGDRLEQLDVYDGKPAGQATEEVEEKASPVAKKTPKREVEGKASPVAKKTPKRTEKSNKRKSKESSESESEEEQVQENSNVDFSDGDDDDSDGKANGKTKSKRGGKGAGRGRGRGRPPSNKSAITATAKPTGGKRGRPRKVAA